MKVGMIGLGRMGEGMSRRLIKCGHEVWGYRNNYEKANQQYEKGYICLLYTSPSPRDVEESRMPSSA